MAFYEYSYRPSYLVKLFNIRRHRHLAVAKSKKKRRQTNDQILLYLVKGYVRAWGSTFFGRGYSTGTQKNYQYRKVISSYSFLLATILIIVVVTTGDVC